MEDEITEKLSEIANLGEYVLRGRVGKGPQSIVWKAEHRSSGEEVALKQVYLSKLNRNLKDCLDCELNFLSSVKHPNIIRLINVIQAEGCIFLVFEFCAGGNLASYIQKHGRVQERIAKRFSQQLGAGLEVLHAHHIIHRDLKPENILLSTPDTDAVLKIADFGLSRIVHPGDYAETVCGSPFYMAPEVLEFQKYDEKVDMWSVGAILFELLNGYPPFHGSNSVQLLQNIKKCRGLPFSQLILPELHPDCIDMRSRQLCTNPGLANPDALTIFITRKLLCDRKYLRMWAWIFINSVWQRFVKLLRSCSKYSLLDQGMQIHAAVVKMGFGLDLIINNVLIDMYRKCSRSDMACVVFDKMLERNVISWTALMGGYLQQGNAKASLSLFCRIGSSEVGPNEFTFSTNLKACRFRGIPENGMQIHVLCLKTGYEGYAQEGSLQEAMDLFRQFRETGIHVDGFVLSSIMSIFAYFTLVEQGKQVYSYTIKFPSGLDISVADSVVDMFLTCGLSEEAERYFEEMPARNVVSWTVMITGYGKHGYGKDAIHLFNKMQSQNIVPDEVTYLAVLSACSRTDLIEESREHFSGLLNDPRMRPKVEHYACMVDLLGRAGCLEEAKNLIENMPLEPTAGIWQTLLVNYVMISNIYAEAGQWGECERVREVMKVKGLKKEASQSWIEIDKENGEEDERRDRVWLWVKFALHDVEEESKEESLRVHSEKLAIGLGLFCGGLEKGGEVIRVFKNLRVCGDCHEFIKGLSKLLKRVFVVRDANRFHRFENGICSCGDYW
ncbi:hypothetical protein HHK36_009289 [Tetracentron sinense]|uniref:Protein kinase domain-containing protein n=1 Tax=Tetracentron sinense TaxID=13715 RepID=A0A835DLH8_TETSI|nr:hypothetical protein HHK36_009289 [Tetracentron sinense]